MNCNEQIESRRISSTDGFVFVFVAPAPSKSVGWAHKSHNSSRQLLRRRGALLCCCTTICSAALQWEILTQMQTVVKYRYFTISPPPNTKYKYKFELCLTTICSAALYHLCCDCCDRLSWRTGFLRELRLLVPGSVTLSMSQHIAVNVIILISLLRSIA